MRPMLMGRVSQKDLKGEKIRAPSTGASFTGMEKYAAIKSVAIFAERTTAIKVRGEVQNAALAPSQSAKTSVSYQT